MADCYLQSDNKFRLLTISEKRNIIRILKTDTSNETQAWYRECVCEKYRLVTLGGCEHLVTADGKMVVSGLEAGKAIIAHHTALKHANEKETWIKLNEVYYNIPRRTVNEYVSKCPECNEKKLTKYTDNGKKNIQVFVPLTEFNFDNRGHVDVIEMPSDDPYNFVLHYTIVNCKFSVLRPLKYNSIIEVASTLIGIFHDFGAPDILQSHSRTYTSDILKELNTLHPEAFLVNGKYKEEHKKFSLAVKQNLISWMSANLCTKWTKALSHVQWQMNNKIHEGFTKTPFEMVFSKKPSFGAASLKAKYKITATMLHEEEVKRLTDLPVSEETKSVVNVCNNRKSKPLSSFCGRKKRLPCYTMNRKNVKQPSQLHCYEKSNNVLQSQSHKNTFVAVAPTQTVLIPGSFIKQEPNSSFEYTQSSFGNPSNNVCLTGDVKSEPNGSLLISEAYSLSSGEHAPPNDITTA